MLYKIKPWEHQLQAIAAARCRAFHLLAFDPGCGKTLTAINIYRQWCIDQKVILSCLVVAPASTLENWRREFTDNCGSTITDSLLVLDGDGLKKAQELKSTTAQVIIVNYEAVNRSKPLFEALLKWRPKVLILDEIHRLRTPGTVTCKRMHQIADICQYKLGLSGTSVLKSLLDLWGQLRALSKDLVHPNYHTWRNQNFYNANANKSWLSFPDWRPLPDTAEKLKKLLASCSSYARKDECLDLPPLVKREVLVSMTKEQDKHYRELEKDFITYLGNEACVTNTAITKLIRLQQVASGFLPLTKSDHYGDDQRLQVIPSGKLPVLKELLREIAPDHKVIIWTNWQASYDQLAQVCEELNLGFMMLTGRTKGKDRQDAIDGFQTDPSVRVFISNPAAGGVGINLQAASVSVHYSKSFNLEHYLQGAARNYRGGSEIHKCITEYHFITRGTVEERIEDALANKISIGEMVTQMRMKKAA